MPSSTPRRAIARLALGGLVAAAIVVGLPLPASAHVTVSAPGAAAGDYTRLTFSVPTESDTETTVRVEVQLPADTPFSSVRTVRVAGWSAELITEALPEPIEGAHGTEITEAVTRVVWTADSPADAIRPDETGLFVLAVGPLPEADELFFPALQVYDSGREVFWSEQASGSAEPDHPAPSLTLTTADDAADSASTAVAAGDSTTASAAAADISSPWLLAAATASIGALAIAIAALVVALRRRPSSA